MANPLWPSSLPQNPYRDNSPQHEPADNVIRTSMETGPAKMRRRFTAVPETVTLPPMELTSAQLATLKTFKKTTLSDVGPFDWIDFRTGTAATYRFLKPLKQDWHSSDGTTDVWTVSIVLELLP